jgi:hypothetical protein
MACGVDSLVKPSCVCVRLRVLVGDICLVCFAGDVVFGFGFGLLGEGEEEGGR